MAQESNPYYIEPMGGYGPSIVKGIGGIGQAMAERGKLQQKQQAQQEVAAAVQSGDVKKVQDIMLKYPELAENAKTAFGFASEETERITNDLSAQLMGVTDPIQAADLIDQYLPQISNAGGSPLHLATAAKGLRDRTQTLDQVKAAAMFLNPDLKSVYDAMQTTGPDIGTYNPRDYTTESFAKFVKSGNPSDLERYIEKTVDIGGVPHKRMEDGTYQPIKPAEQVAQNKAMITKASEIVKAEVQGVIKGAEGKKSNETAWNVYDTGMRNLADAMAGTTTAPGMAWMPAVTANQQIAEGAVAVMAPVLKQMFRAAGEGVFTDKDQQMLMGMVPTRNDLPEARAAKIAAIDAIVRAKLNMNEQGEIKQTETVDWSQL